MASKDALWDSGHDESVEVNQRALIDKVLARYSGEFTVFRELLQNSDDASSSAVEIHFNTQEYLKWKASQANGGDGNFTRKLLDLKTEPVHQWTFKNDGIVFRDEDWSRLKKIAEGNPDEEKIGAFGVGFYSLFSVTEEPFVTSGGQWMGFYWKDKKDQLFARRGALPSPSTVSEVEKQWTTFEMPLRESAPIPIPFDLARFLASSITFMVHLREVSVWFDDQRLVYIRKDIGAPKSVAIPRGLNTKSPSGIMIARSISSTPLYIDAEIARCVYASGTAAVKKLATQTVSKAKTELGGGFFASLFSSFTSASGPISSAVGVPGGFSSSIAPPPPEKEVDPMEIKKTSVVLHTFTVTVDVRLDKKMAQELNRATKKNAPPSVKLNLIYTGKDEYDASMQEDGKIDQSTGSVFQGLRADLDGSGSARVFIGHSTGQTTGIGGHIAARFIPTVERESIDFMDRNVSLWNKELLYIAGFLARTAYETEMENIKDLWLASAESGKDGKADEQVQKWLTERCLHALKFFTFHPSTPSPVVSNVMEQAFFSCAHPTQHPFLIMSSVGVKPAVNVRVPDPTFEKFLKGLPVLPKEIMENAKMMVDNLTARGMISPITFEDVLKELRDRPLSEEEMIACISWWARLWNSSRESQGNLIQIRQRLLDAAVLIVGPGTSNERIIPLSSIQTFINLRTLGAIIPLEGGVPLPEHCLPLSVSRSSSPNDLASAFGWHELTIVEWLRSVANQSADPEHDISLSATWAERVLNSLTRAWPSLSRPHQQEVAAILAQKACIPTRNGMKQPGDAYFPNAHVFPDLPVVSLPSGAVVRGNLEKVLEGLGVRKHVDLQIVFTRMIKTGDWNTSDLIKYLVAVQQTLTPMEIDRLKQTAAFPKEVPAGVNLTDDEKRARYKASDLYEPSDVLRSLKLPILDWGGNVRWRPSSEEAKFLYALGLRRYPPLGVLIKLAGDSDETLRSNALKYFLDNHSRYPEYDPANFSDVAFIPARTPDGKFHLAKPSEVFVEQDSGVFGFSVIDDSIRDVAVEKLRLRRSPPPGRLLALLENSSPKDPVSARKWFEILVGHIAEFSPSQLVRLSQLPIVPVGNENGSTKDNGPTSNRIRMMAPKDCYFKREGSQALHSKLFTFVDFGTKANGFLSACGTKNEPSVEEIVQILLNDPAKFYHLAGGRESYLIELRNIAINFRLLSGPLITRMKRLPILLGSQRVQRKKDEKKAIDSKAVDDLDEEEWDAQYDLLKPDQVVIADDINAYRIFGDSIFCAPQEDILEEFYARLGSPRLSSLVHDDYKTSVEIKDSRIAKDIRALVLERLPLFLHEQSHARTKIQYSWLNNPKNFIVRTFGKLVVTKHLTFGSTRLSRAQDASAAARKIAYGPVELWLAGNAQIDMYEVAISLCRILFETPKPNDALLFMTILSTDLRALRRRGYNVDRILRQQRADREAEEQARKKKADDDRLLSDTVNSGVIQDTRPLPTIPVPSNEKGQLPPVPQQPATPGRPGSPGPSVQTSDSETLTDKNRATSLMKSLQNMRKRFSVAPEQPNPTGPSYGGLLPSRPIARAPTPNARPHTPQKGVTPLSNIQANIEQAISACKEELGNVLQNREQMQIVRESLEEGYCDISGSVGDLDYIGSMADVKVYVTKDVPQGAQLLQTKHDVIARFIHVIRPLRTLYNLPPTSIHIFCDAEGGTIAFNRNASIFVNLRYYEAWHDADVQQGDLSKAFTSWFFSLAHEIAHNLVHPHNSEHEFYFSSICEAHVHKLLQLLSSSS